MTPEQIKTLEDNLAIAIEALEKISQPTTMWDGGARSLNSQ